MDTVRRALQQLFRYKTRNTVIAIQIIIIVVLITALSTILFQLDQMFKNDNLSYTKQLTIIEVNNQDISEELLTYLNKSNKVDFYLPYSSFNPGNNLYMETKDYYIWPNEIAFYDPEKIKNPDSKFLQTSTNKNGVIVPENFKSFLIPKNNYQKLYGESDLPNKGNLEDYQNLNIPLHEGKQNIINGSIKFSYYNDFVSESSTSANIPIFGKYSSEYQFDVSFMFQLFFLVPNKYKEQVLHENSPSMPMNLIVVADKASSVPALLKKIEEIGYSHMNNLDIFQRRADNNKELMMDLFLFVLVIGSVSVLNFINILYGSLKERRKEIAVMKSLGISKKKFLTLFSTETLILVAGSTLISFIIVEGLFSLIQNFIQKGIVKKEYYNVFHLGSDSVQFLFQTPWMIYGLAFFATIAVSLIVTYFPVSKMYNKPYFKLYRW
ncbi:ABC transporter permease [Virgibacillus sp. DJP39]|uniref:ABC transporter permease n=1 Tax=Virgibacillus sp. DJP39 TaxID=3409790 RepID=UPI003BB57A54